MRDEADSFRNILALLSDDPTTMHSIGKFLPRLAPSRKGRGGGFSATAACADGLRLKKIIVKKTFCPQTAEFNSSLPKQFHSMGTRRFEQNEPGLLQGFPHRRYHRDLERLNVPAFLVRQHRCNRSGENEAVLLNPRVPLANSSATRTRFGV